MMGEPSTPHELLFIDIEGGHGGSSRSLRLLVEHLDRQRFSPTVWHRRDSGYGAQLEKANINHLHEPRIRSIVPRVSKNWKIWLTTSPSFHGLRDVATAIRRVAPDVLHLNYEGLVPLLWMVGRTAPPFKIVLHFRTNSPANWIARKYAQVINRHVDQLVFISENERDIAVAAGVNLDRIPSEVMYNPVPMLAESGPEVRRTDDAEPLRLGYLATLDEIRGGDRLIELAEALRKHKVNAKIEAYGGSPGYRKLLIFPRRTLEGLRERVAHKGLCDWITYHGRTEEPDTVMQQFDLVLWPARSYNPWGRSILEAMAQGIPVMGLGQYDKFVIDGETGCLFDRWDPGAWAKAVQRIDDERAQLDTLSKNARRKVADLCDPNRYADRMMKIYDRLIDAPSPAGE